MVSYGLIAGMRKDEIDEAKPGMILDLFYYRGLYDKSMSMRM